MYFSKESVLTLYGSLSSLYPKDDIEQQGGTQFVSEIKYFLATDYFKRQKGKPCDTQIKEDKEFFVHSVGKVVLLSDNGNYLATKNFAKSVGDARDFDVGSNFFSANAVAKSKITPDPQKFPNRHPQLLTIISGVIDTYSGGYKNLANDKEYLGGNIRKYAILFLWLNRFSDFSSKDSIYNVSLFNLEKNFSSELISSLRWNSKEVKDEVEQLLIGIQLIDKKPTFERDDFYKLPTQTPVNIKCFEINSIQNTPSIPFPHNRIIFGAPGTGKSYLLNENAEKYFTNENIERVTFHPNYSYAQFVGSYKPFMASDTQSDKLSGDEKRILDILTDNSKSGQEKYDLLYPFFKEENSLTRLPLLLGLYTDESFKTKKQDGTDAVNDNNVERNHGRAIRPYVNLVKNQMESEQITYQYVPGPFMRIYATAKQNPSQNFLLIIEEINRANVAAVFGDIFQLLDRKANGESEYPVAASEDIKKYLAKNGIYEDELSIPSNMYIWATMNSADQGVFPMDTAFKRRWEFEYIGIDDNEKNVQDYEIPINSNKKVNWNELRKVINDKLIELSVNEDKLLGPFFLSKNILGNALNDTESFIKLFKSKVIMYLFEDAAKLKAKQLFKIDSNKYIFSEICKQFDEKGLDIFGIDPSIVKISDITCKNIDNSKNNSSDFSLLQ